MNEEEKKDIELDIEAKYVGKTKKEFLSGLTYEECLYILTPENKYCDKIIKLSVLKICEIIEKLQKENKKYKQFFDLMLRLDSDYFMNCGDEETNKLVDEILKLESE